MSEISITFERALYHAVIRYKREHPGALEARTKQRKEGDETHGQQLQVILSERHPAHH